MRKIGFALAAVLILALVQGGWLGAGARAATGDTLIVTGDGVNVRYEPNTEAKVRMRVYHDQLVTEIERQGDWVRAEVAGSDGAEGWIHGSLVAVPTPAELTRARERATAPPGGGLPEAKPPAVPPGAIKPAPAELTRARERASAPPGGGLPEAKPPVPPGAIKPAPAEPVPPAAASEPPAPPVGRAADVGSTAATPTTGTATATPQPDVPAPHPPAPDMPAPHAAAPDERSPDVAGTPIAPAREPSAIEPAAGPVEAADAADLARFRASVDYLNSRSASVAGVDLFDGVEAAGNGVVRVGATDAWSTIPPAGQQSYANTLLDRWAAARAYRGPVKIQIVDSNGKVLLESAKP